MSIDERNSAAPRGTLRRPARTVRERTLLRYGVRPLLVLLDVAAFGVAVAATGPLRGLHVVLLALTLGLFASAGLYRPRLSLSVLDDLPSLAGRPLAAVAVTTTLGAVLHATYPVESLLVTAIVMVVAIPALRCLGYAVVRRVRHDGVVAHPTLVLGAGRVGGHVARVLQEHPEYGLRPVGFLDSDPLLDEAERPVPLLGGTDALSRVIVEFGVHDVIVAFGSLPESEMVAVLRTCDRLDTEIFFVPRLFELASRRDDTEEVWGLPLVRLPRSPYRSASWRMKRLLDVVLAGSALVLLLPVLLVCATAVALEQGPGIFFAQERVGLDGRSFRVWKFRSLRPADESESRTRWHVGGDERVGPVGRVLRKTSLDELPQLWNIIRGDMSLVGPRPERPHFASVFAESFPRYDHRHRVPVGLTGWAQVHGLRGDTSIEDRARFDNYYIENWSLWTDVKIVVRTVGQVVRGGGG